MYEVFDDAEAALKYLENAPIPTVIKADGLALGKGVIIATERSEAIEAVNSIMMDKKFGASGNRIVIEEFLEGPEVSVLAFTDGKTLVPMVSSMDHKRALTGDLGLNTGGMGTVAPNPYYTAEIAEECMKTIFLPTIDAMNKEGRTFRGCLYFGLMVTKDGPKVIALGLLRVFCGGRSLCLELSKLFTKLFKLLLALLKLGALLFVLIVCKHSRDLQNLEKNDHKARNDDKKYDTNGLHEQAHEQAEYVALTNYLTKNVICVILN